MKKNDFLIAGTTTLYSILFYHQSAGLNFFLFSIALCILLFINFREQAHSIKWKLAAAGTLLSGFSVYYLDNSLTVWSNLLSLALLSAFTFEPRTSVITAWCYSAFTLFTSIGFMVVDLIARNNPGTNSVPKKRIGLLAILLPIFIILVFFLLYRDGNALFYDFTKNINLEFISVSWVCFTTGGFFLMYSFFCYRTIPELLEPESRIPDKLDAGRTAPAWWRNLLPLSQEYFSGLILLIALNLLTLVLNLLDCKFLFLDGKLPAGITYSQFVHTGVGTLIFSIVVAILVVLFYFRAELNFGKGKKVLAWLTYAWIAQNVFMLYSGALKNGMYIHEYTLTYRRIGVYVWLLLALFGIVTTAIKIYRTRTNYFLFRVNAWLCYGSLVIAALFNWDRSIAEYNIRYSKKVDYPYLISLSYNTFPSILEAFREGRMKNEQIPYDPSEDFLDTRNEPNKSVSAYLGEELAAFLDRQSLSQWQSACISKQLVEAELRASVGKIKSDKQIVTYIQNR